MSNNTDIEALVDRNSLASLSQAEFDARVCTQTLGYECIGVDRGSHVSPRYDVVRMWQLGDKVSKAFNGDCYPEGTITRISDSKRMITTSTGLRFYRRADSGSWIQQGGTWQLCLGHVEKRNPSF